MIGVLLASLSALFEEVSASISKFEAYQKKESAYTLGFLNIFWGFVFLSLLALTGRVPFVFAAASVPTFALRMVLEVFQTYATIQALILTSRSTFSFVRSLTIPLLLGVDFFLGYAIDPFQAIGVSLIVLALLVAFAEHELDRQGLGLLIFSAVNSVLTISLYKYNVSHFNSVTGEGVVGGAIFLVILFFMAWRSAGENPFNFLRQRTFFAQSATQGVASVASGFAVAFVPASVAIAAGRASLILWSTISGHRYFAERHFVAKLALAVVLAGGIVLLAL